MFRGIVKPSIWSPRRALNSRFTPLAGRYIHSATPKRQFEVLAAVVPDTGHDPGRGNNDDGDNNNKDKKSKEDKKNAKWREVGVKIAETGSFMITSLVLLGLAGLVYHRGYKENALRKMSAAFDQWDPVLEMATDMKSIESDDDWIERDLQPILDDIIAGRVSGRYYVLFGEKGTGKTSMLLSAIRKIQGKDVVVMEAHADPEVLRIRMGKALRFEFHEDYLGSLFSIRGPRENSAILDIERAFNMLEEVALRRVKQSGKPIVLVINGAHLIRDDETGRDMVELLQQKAEALSGSGLGTVVFNSDDYWLYERLKKLGTRMDVISVSDFTKSESIQALRRLRRRAFNEELTYKEAESAYHLVGGRPQHLAAVAAQPNILMACQRLIDREKQWFLNQCGLLGEDMDDDVMDSGKFATAAMSLAQEFVRLDEQQGPQEEIMLPRIPLWRARQIMTRPDFIQAYDNLNLFTLDSLSRVKPDSVVMMHAFREIVSMPGFTELLAATQNRVDAIESLGRTREVVLKDLVNSKGAYVFEKNRLTFDGPEDDEDDDDDDEDDRMYMLDNKDRFYWKARMRRSPSSQAPKAVVGPVSATKPPDNPSMAPREARPPANNPKE